MIKFNVKVRTDRGQKSPSCVQRGVRFFNTRGKISLFYFKRSFAAAARLKFGLFSTARRAFDFIVAS